MLLKLGDETLIARAWRIACEAFDRKNCVIAIPRDDLHSAFGDELCHIGAKIFAFDGDERDVLGRFWHCAHTYRWNPESVVFRYTPDDPFKSPMKMRRVAFGERLPVEIGGEAFTLAMLDAAQQNCDGAFPREHITHALFPGAPPPPAPPGVWTIDTEVDYIEACVRVESVSIRGYQCVGGPL